jgi:hypothetical protein
LWGEQERFVPASVQSSVKGILRINTRRRPNCFEAPVRLETIGNPILHDQISEQVDPFDRRRREFITLLAGRPNFGVAPPGTVNTEPLLDRLNVRFADAQDGAGSAENSFWLSNGFFRPHLSLSHYPTVAVASMTGGLNAQ